MTTISKPISTQDSIYASFKQISQDQLSLFCSHLQQIEDVESATINDNVNDCVRIITNPNCCITYGDISAAANKSGLKLTYTVNFTAITDYRILINAVVEKLITN